MASMNEQMDEGNEIREQGRNEGRRQGGEGGMTRWINL